MGFLCFGSVASPLKDAMKKSFSANNAVVPLLFGAIDEYYRTGEHDRTNCGNWLKGRLKLPASIASPKVVPNPDAVETYFANNVLPKMDTAKASVFYQTVYSLVMPNENISVALKHELEVALIAKRYAFFHSRVFLFAVTQSNETSGILDDIVLLPLPTKPTLDMTSVPTGFDRVFKLVSDAEKLSHKPDHFIRLFRLDVQAAAIVFDDFSDYLEKNLGEYVFSRAMRDRLIDDGHERNIGKKAVELLKKAGGLDMTKISEELGDIVLYVLLEQNLIAPKIYNKIELAATGAVATNQGGIHLLPLGDDDSSFQIVVAKSNVVGDLKTAIDNAFVAIVAAKNSTSAEYKLLDSSILDMSFSDQKLVEYLRSTIIPSKRKTEITVKNAFGVFLGYSIGLSPADYDVAPDYAQAVADKMAEDIKSKIAYIESKIAAENLSGHSFYFYLIPFNDADTEKIAIMQTLVGGVV